MFFLISGSGKIRSKSLSTTVRGFIALYSFANLQKKSHSLLNSVSFLTLFYLTHGFLYTLHVFLYFTYVPILFFPYFLSNFAL